MKLMRLEEGTERMTEAEKLLEQCGYELEKFSKYPNFEVIVYTKDCIEHVSFNKHVRDEEYTVEVYERDWDNGCTTLLAINADLAYAIYAMLKELNGAE